MTASDELDTCGCCGGVHAPEPDNRPGLPALRWRGGTYAGVLARMKARLPEVAIADGASAGLRPLVDLTTRAPHDPTIAMLDAWAVTADILGFYTERIANEGYLRTATERRSIRELARTIGYELSPGVGASTYVAFTVDDPLPSPGLPPPPPFITIPVGTKIQSVPLPKELPQTFETSAEIEGRAGWNAIQPRQRARVQLAIVDGTVKWLAADGGLTRVARLWLAGDVTSIKPGDRLLIRVSAANHAPTDPVSLSGLGGSAVVTVAAVEVERPTDPTRPTYTRIELVGPDAPDPAAPLPDLPDGQAVTNPIEMTAATIRTWILRKAWTEAALATFLAIQRWDADAVVAQVAALAADAPEPADVHRFRTKVGVFGHNAPLASQVIAGFEPGKNPWANWDSADRPVSVWTTSGSPLVKRSDHLAKAAQTAAAATSSTAAKVIKASSGSSMQLEVVAPGAGLAAMVDLPGMVAERRLYRAIYGADLFLERTVDLAPDGWAVLEAPGVAPESFAVHGVVDAALADFAISGKATGLDLGLGFDYKTGAGAAFRMRTTTVHAASEPVALAAPPLVDTVGRAGAGVNRITLDRMVIGLVIGRVVAITGDTVDEDRRPTGIVRTELATLAQIRHVGGVTVLHLEAPLAYGYQRATMTINANVAPANHGETVTGEVLGSGDATRAGQRFVLKRPPVTYVSTASASGSASTVEIEVDGVVWTERPHLYGAGHRARCYMLVQDDDGRTTVVFGDGVDGARLPTGRDNITATYRTGIGIAGQIDAGRLAIMPQKPLGLRGGVNPVAATGAEDPETLDVARRSAPLTVLTLDRVVSRVDYEDFARGFAGVGKAVATEVWSGRRRIVHVTIAATTPGPIDPTSALYTHLVTAIAGAGDPSQGFAVDGYLLRRFAVEATLVVAPRTDRDEIVDRATARLRGHFGFAARDLAQPVTASEVIAVLDRVPGVVAVELALLHAAHDLPSLRAAIPAPAAHHDAATRRIVPATLLTIQPHGIALATQVARERAS